jgi:hypothetical protein
MIRQCQSCEKKLYKDYRRTDIFDKGFHLCSECGIVSFQPWPGGERLEGKLFTIQRRVRGKRKEKTLTVHTKTKPEKVIELRELTFTGVPGLPPGLGSSAKVLRIRPLYTAKPPKKKKKKPNAEESTPAEETSKADERKTRFKREIMGYSITACFGTYRRVLRRAIGGRGFKGPRGRGSLHLSQDNENPF